MGRNPYKRDKQQIFDEIPAISKSEYREILLAKMAGGDMDAGEKYRKIRRFDILLDIIRIKPIYPKKELDEILREIEKRKSLNQK